MTGDGNFAIGFLSKKGSPVKVSPGVLRQGSVVSPIGPTLGA